MIAFKKIEKKKKKKQRGRPFLPYDGYKPANKIRAEYVNNLQAQLSQAYKIFSHVYIYRYWEALIFYFLFFIGG